MIRVIESTGHLITKDKSIKHKRYNNAAGIPMEPGQTTNTFAGQAYIRLIRIGTSNIW